MSTVTYLSCLAIRDDLLPSSPVSSTQPRHTSCNSLHTNSNAAQALGSSSIAASRQTKNSRHADTRVPKAHTRSEMSGGQHHLLDPEALGLLYVQQWLYEHGYTEGQRRQRSLAVKRQVSGSQQVSAASQVSRGPKGGRACGGAPRFRHSASACPPALVRSTAGA